MTISGSTLYGTTAYGGANGDGNVFSINTDGSGFQNLLSFSGTNGANPIGSLTLCGSSLYGTTNTGGASGDGTIFSIKTDGSGFQSLLSFSGTSSALPGASLTISGSTLYGMTAVGGANGYGNIFSINTDGSGLRNVFSFDGSNGNYPAGGLTLSGSTLYGMTENGGGGRGLGNVFSIKTEGSGFQNLVSFNGVSGTYTGQYPVGSLTLSGSTLYGMTFENSPSSAFSAGNIFSVRTDGSGFQNLLSFNGIDGALPTGDLTLIGSTLYGMTQDGGANGLGNIFSINTDGSGYKDLFSFNGANGEYPEGSLTLVGSTLYGMTEGGGDNGEGVVFSLTVPEPSTFVMLVTAAVGLLGWAWRRRAPAA